MGGSERGRAAGENGAETGVPDVDAPGLNRLEASRLQKDIGSDESQLYLVDKAARKGVIAGRGAEVHLEGALDLLEAVAGGVPDGNVARRQGDGHLLRSASLERHFGKACRG